MRPSRIVTFYSYKGGAGRSMALANVAWILASNGQRVLLIDWDLESPGLHHYFRPFLNDPAMATSLGIIDYFIEFAADAASGIADTGKTLLHYASSLEWDFPSNGTIDFVGPGRMDASYAFRVNAFSWQSFYERLGGNSLLDRIRAELTAEYDYILIDSRGGVSDYGSICTITLPDTLVVCFTLNAQSLEGAAAVAANALAQRRETPLTLFPVSMRVDYAEKDLLQRAREAARGRFEPLVLKNLDSDYWGAVEFPYVPFYTYNEMLAAFADAPYSTPSVLTAAENLTRYISHGTVSRHVPLPEKQRLDVRQAYATGSNASTQFTDVLE